MKRPENSDSRNDTPIVIRSDSDIVRSEVDLINDDNEVEVELTPEELKEKRRRKVGEFAVKSAFWVGGIALTAGLEYSAQKLGYSTDKNILLNSIGLGSLLGASSYYIYKGHIDKQESENTTHPSHTT